MSSEVQKIELLGLVRMARLIEVPTDWLRFQAESGNLPGLCINGRWRFSAAAVLAAYRNLVEQCHNVNSEEAVA